MLVMVKRVGQVVTKKEIDKTNSLAELQGLVEGYIEAVPFEKGITILVNEEGRLMHLPPNIVSYRGVLVGTVVFCATKNSDFAGLSTEQIQFVEQYCGSMQV